METRIGIAFAPYKSLQMRMVLSAGICVFGGPLLSSRQHNTYVDVLVLLFITAKANPDDQST